MREQGGRKKDDKTNSQSTGMYIPSSLICDPSPPIGMIPLMCGEREVIMGWAELGC